MRTPRNDGATPQMGDEIETPENRADLRVYIPGDPAIIVYEKGGPSPAPLAVLPSRCVEYDPAAGVFRLTREPYDPQEDLPEGPEPSRSRKVMSKQGDPASPRGSESSESSDDDPGEGGE